MKRNKNHKNHKNFTMMAVGLILLLPFFLYAERFKVKAERGHYYWDIKKLILEKTKTTQPEVRKTGEVLRADTIIHDDTQNMSYAYGNIYFKDTNQGIEIKAGTATYDGQNNELDLSQGPVVYFTKENMKTKSFDVKIYSDTKTVFWDGDVFMDQSNRIIEGDSAVYYEEMNVFDVKGNGSMEDKDQSIYGNQITVIFKDKNKKKIKNYVAIGNVSIIDRKKKVNINCDKVTYDGQLNTIFLKGNVKVNDKTKKVILYADQIVRKIGIEMVATGSVRVEDSKSSSIITARSVKKDEIQEETVAKGDVVVLNSKNQTKISADTITLDKSNNKRVAQGSVSLQNFKDDSVAYCDKLEDYEKQKFSRLTGNSKIIFNHKDIQIYANTIENNREKKVSHLLGNVIVVDKEKKSYSRWGRYDQQSETMELTGNPILEFGKSKLDGTKILVDIKSETMSVIGQGKGFFYMNML